MKSMKRLLALVLVSLPGVLCAQSGDFVINGKTNPGSKVVKVYTYSMYNGVDSAVVTNGRFHLKGTLKFPAAITFLADKQGKGFDNACGTVSPVLFFEEPGETSIDIPDSISLMVVKGGKSNAELMEYNKLIAVPYLQAVEVWTKLQTASKEDEAALWKKRKVLLGQISSLSLQFAAKHRDSYVSVDKLVIDVLPYADITGLLEVEKLYAGFTDEIKKSRPGMDFTTRLASIKATTIGGTAADFTNVDSLDHEVSLQAFKGRYVLLDFWASWCGPCRAENPNVIKAYQNFKDKNFTVLAISLDKKSNRGKWLKAVSDDKLPYPQIWDFDGKTAGKYLIRAIPQNFLIDPSGKIIAKNLRGDALQIQLAKLLNTKS
jgi:thiol-disulfide isomerase/thioredoxin